MLPSITHTANLMHDFIAHISRIEFDFSGTDWEDEFRSEKEWSSYQAELNSKYSNCSILFEGIELPDSDEEDETVGEFYESTHCCEEGYYYRCLESWIDENIGWCLLDLEYSIEKIS